MNCQRAQQIDLAAFLLEPRDAAFGDFREHYPGCPECSAAVAEGTRLEQALRSMGDAGEGHPDPDLLACWHADRDVLDPDARERMSRHLEGCTPCREELRALRAFDPAALAAPATSVRPQPVAEERPPWLRYLIWSPASAIAIAGVVLAPFVYLGVELGGRIGTIQEQRRSAPVERRFALEESQPPRFPALPAEGLASVGEPTPPLPSPAAAAERAFSGTIAAGRSGSGDVAERAGSRDVGERSTATLERSQTSPLPVRARAGAGALAAMSSRHFSLGSETLRIDASVAARGIELRVPIPERWRAAPGLVLWLSDGRGRERSDRLQWEPGSHTARVVLEPDWLGPGTWHAQLAPPRARGEAEHFVLEVR